MRGTVAYLAAQEHVNELIREAEHTRGQAEFTPRRRIALSLPRFSIRRAPRTYRPDPANTARAGA
jgi:hypothetical protein